MSSPFFRPFRGRLALAVFALLFAAAAAPIPTLAQEAPAAAASAAGQWQGAIDTPGTALDVVIDLSQAADGTWQGDVDIPLQGAEDLPLAGFEVDGATVRFSIAGVPGNPTFAGSLSDDGDTLAGTFTQGGAEFPFHLQRAGEATVAERIRDDEALAGFGDWMAARARRLEGARRRGGDRARRQAGARRGLRPARRRGRPAGDRRHPVRHRLGQQGVHRHRARHPRRRGQARLGRAGAHLPARLPALRRIRLRPGDAARPGVPPHRPAAPRPGVVRLVALPPGALRPPALPRAERRTARDLPVPEPDVHDRRLPRRPPRRQRLGDAGPRAHLRAAGDGRERPVDHRHAGRRRRLPRLPEEGRGRRGRRCGDRRADAVPRHRRHGAGRLDQLHRPRHGALGRAAARRRRGGRHAGGLRQRPGRAPPAADGGLRRPAGHPLQAARDALPDVRHGVVRAALPRPRDDPPRRQHRRLLGPRHLPAARPPGHRGAHQPERHRPADGGHPAPDRPLPRRRARPTGASAT